MRSKRAREFRPDLILLDKEIDGMDGGYVAARLQREPSLRGVPIAFVTGGLTRDEAAAETVPDVAEAGDAFGTAGIRGRPFEFQRGLCRLLIVGESAGARVPPKSIPQSATPGSSPSP